MRKPSRSLQLVTLVAVLGLLGSTGCVRGGSKAAKSEADASAAKAKAAATAAANGATKNWLEGKLPASEWSGTPQQGGGIVVRINESPPSLNTLVDADLWATWIVENGVYEYLARPDPYDDPRYRFKPELATSWEVSKDGLTYTFHLRHGVKWQDGQPFTADDVVATFKKIMDPTTKSVFVRSSLKGFEGVKKLDEYTVQFKWKKRYFLAMDVMQVPIQPAHIIGKLTGSQYNNASTDSLNRHPIGTGPFEFVRWDANEKIVFKRNPHYWGKPAHLDRLTFRIVKDPTVNLELAAKGQLDVATTVLANQWVRMAKQWPKLVHNFYRSKYYSNNYAWIGWNEHRPFFKDARVRKAMTLLTNRKGIVQDMMYGVPRQTNCTFYWKSNACDPSLKLLPFDPPAAVKLLKEAGWTDHDGDGILDKDGVKFSFTFMIPASSVDAKRMATAMKEDYRRAGIDMKIQMVEWSAFTRRLTKHDFDACTLLWGGGPRTDPTQIWASSSAKGGSNYIFFSNKKADELIAEARGTLDAAKRQALYHQFDKILYDEQPYTFLYTRPRLDLVSRRVHGARQTLYGWQWKDFWVETGKPSKPASAPTAAKTPPPAAPTAEAKATTKTAAKTAGK